MGYLHEGHLSLVRLARARDDVVAVSIFVNPAQFGPNEDFARYPRDLQRDLDLLKREGVDAVFAPAVDEMYPSGNTTSIDIGAVAQPNEGASRPGHFAGVATVVAKLFNIVQPDRAYFGQKDAQQLAVIRRMVSDLAFPVVIEAGPTVREADGLAMSSRNAYLGAEERRAATVICRALVAGQDAFRGGETDAEALRRRIRAVIAEEPLAKVDYVSVADAATMEELVVAKPGSLASLAVRIGTTRLIDNIILE